MLDTPSNTRRLGWFGLVTSIITVGTFAVAYLTPPRSGPFCTSGCITAPYTDAARFVPRDYVWMYPAVLVSLLFLGVIMALTARSTARGRGLLARCSAGIGVVAVTTLVIDYGVQLAVVQPMLARGEATGLGVLTQYNPVGLFIGLEDIGYTAMAVSFLLAGFAVVPERPVERVLRWVLVIGGLVTVGLLVTLGASYGADLDYRYEVAAISVTWLTLAVAGAALGWQGLRPSPGPRRPPTALDRPDAATAAGARSLR
jgi:hypothetical protein